MKVYGGLLLTLALLFTAFLGCSEESPIAKNGDPEGDVAVGVITEIIDATPVDGGIDIVLSIDGGGTDRAHMPSLFTMPPPPPERLELFQQLRKLDVGARVRVEGEREGESIRIETITVLDDEA